MLELAGWTLTPSKVGMDCDSNSARLSIGPQAWLLNNGTRLHLQHGPIDLIIDAMGEHAHVRVAYKQAAVAFNQILDCLAAQLPVLRKSYNCDTDSDFVGPVAIRMRNAVKLLGDYNVTPMIAVAGAVSDHVLSCMVKECKLVRAQVNNGGDIALFLSDGASVKIGICTDLEKSDFQNILTVSKEHGIGGVATSGWQGRSHSLGIADAVTVVASTAAAADVAATLIANAVDLPNSVKVSRLPATEIEPDSDLGERLVTVGVAPLTVAEKMSALKAGEIRARHLMSAGDVVACFLHLQGLTRVVGAPSSKHLLSASKTHAHG